jgi:predicted glycosyltransferase
MLAFARGKRFDYGLAHGSTDLPPVARLLRLPNTTMFDYEWAKLQHAVNCRLATRVLIPDAIPAERVARYGARPPKLVRYPGLKEEYYLSGFEPDRSVLADLGVDEARSLAVVRTAPSYALYLGGSENELLPRVVRRLLGQDAQVVALARTDEQRAALGALDERLVVPAHAVDARSLAGLADVVVSAGGTMIREAAVLGTPTWSIFEGRPGAVDELLEREGRIRWLRDPAELVVEKVTARERRAERDPAELLRLAIPTFPNAARDGDV